MTPRRRYSMGRRAEAVAETRREIVRAAAEAFRDIGIRATSMQEVARRADVAPGTVLNHFPERDGLIEAVIESITESLRLPSAGLLQGVDSAQERIRLLVREIYHFYERSEEWVGMFFREQGEVPALREGERKVMLAIGELATTALGSAAGDRKAFAVLAAVIEPGHRGALVRSGLSASEAIDTAAEVVLSWLETHLEGGFR